MSIQLDEVFAEIKWFASRYPTIEKIVLYGSGANGDHKEEYSLELIELIKLGYLAEFGKTQ